MREHRLAAVVAVAAAFQAVACSVGPAGPQAGGFPPTAVQLATATPGPIEQASEYVGTLRSLRSTPVQPEIDGQITDVFVTSGERVAPGARIAQIDPRRQEAAVSSQEAELSSRQADVNFARQQSDRANELFKAGAISRQEIEQAQTALQTAEARLKALQAQVREQQVQLRYYTVTAPTSGIVGDVPVRVGNRVTPQTILTTIDQNATLEVQVQVPVERAGALKNGLPLELLSSDGSEKLSTTSVDFISPHVDDQTQSILVKGPVQNLHGTLRPSQSVRVRVIWSTSPGLVVPVTAVVRINGQFFAFVAEDSKGDEARSSPPGLVARQRAITVGSIAGDSYPVVSGLAAGDRLIVSGIQKLADGAPIVQATPPARQ